jgi:hypothetical protein
MRRKLAKGQATTGAANGVTLYRLCFLKNQAKLWASPNSLLEIAGKMLEIADKLLEIPNSA